jgi:hypothetical protein
MANTPADGWDDDEREAVAGFEHELDSLRARHARSPEVELLRAAEAEVLPDDLQRAGAAFLASDRWSRALVEGLNEADPSLDRQDEARLLDRIQREANVSRRPRVSWSWMWPSFAVVAGAIIAILWVTRPTVAPAPPSTTQPPVAVSPPRPAPVYALALEKPEVKLSLATLTWRGTGRAGDLVADLKPGLDAFRGNDFTSARRELGALTAKYPNAIEVFLYLGASQSQLGEFQAAFDSLTRAVALADTADTWFGVEAAWQRAIAQERLGRKEDARVTLMAICNGHDARARAACAAAASLR